MAIPRGARQNGLPEQTGNGTDRKRRFGDGWIHQTRPTTTTKKKAAHKSSKIKLLNFPFPAVSGAALSSDVARGPESQLPFPASIPPAVRTRSFLCASVCMCAAGQTRKIKKTQIQKTKTKSGNGTRNRKQPLNEATRKKAETPTRRECTFIFNYY